jgi:TPR repeat protein
MFFMGTTATPRNKKYAFKWYSLAARKGHSDSQYIIAGMFKSGQGTLQDYSQAHMWWNIVGATGDENSSDYVKASRVRRAALEKLMTPSQIETAQRLARECVAKNYKGCGE